jgi:hypothetical protein
MNVPSDNPETRPIVPATAARQGVTGHNVRYVLGIGVAAGVALLAGIWLYYFA